MKINIASFGGRSHLLDTARELEKFGHEVRFYSYVPTKRALKFRLKKECNKSHFVLALPFLALCRITHNANWMEQFFHWFFDIYTGLTMAPCDVFIGHRPRHKFTLQWAKKKYNAIVILEEGAIHVLTQKRIIESMPNNRGKTIIYDWQVKKSLASYELADYISIASAFQKHSMLENGISEKKLFINPYGVDLSQFYPTDKPTAGNYDVIMVGGWRYLKGCDLIIDAIRKLDLRFLHVGAIVDMAFPQDNNFTHFDSVNQWHLVNYYSQSKILIFPSRQDGFGMVLSQALACGLPIVCSKNTGGSNLKDFLEDKKWIVEMPEYSADCLAECIQEALQLTAIQPEGKRNYAGDAINNLTWEAYGKRYNDFLMEISQINV
jgi:glycosyltransferase involved in cell wall biosynthesis